MRYPTLNAVIPVPAFCTPSRGVLLPSALRNCCAAPEAKDFIQHICRTFNFFGFCIDEGVSSPAVSLRFDADCGKEGFRLSISTDGIVLVAGGNNGFRYGISALTQMLFAACSRGADVAELECGEIADQPRFAYRSFMLDSARHFQSADTIRQLLFLLSALRINVFHWHLVDSQGWRLPLKCLPQLPKATQEAGCYTKEELRSIAKLAQSLGIEIVPEIDVPGHSGGILKSFPQYACNPEQPGKEYCIGNPDSLAFIKAILSEVMEIFPDSRTIHLGGDEADTAAWEACPRCRKAMTDKGLNNPRELEHAFMLDLVNFVRSKGKRAMVWGICSDLAYPADTVIQAWLDIREPLRVATHGNPVVFSVHTSLYFDYPARASEPQESWMFALPVEGVYMTDPWIIWKDKLEKTILGTEACLWTEQIPEWRVFPKIMPRIGAYAEVAWSEPSRKNYYDFVRRSDLLESAGYFDFVQYNRLEFI